MKKYCHEREYVWKTYHFNYPRGTRVKHIVTGEVGRITSYGGGYVRVCFDGYKNRHSCHPDELLVITEVNL